MENAKRRLSICGECIGKYTIVYPEHSYPSEKTAAQELAKYIKLTCGTDVPLVDDRTPVAGHEIVVGHTNREGEGYTIPRENYAYEGYVILTVGKKLVIAGAEQRGTMYGVYDFIEKYLGWRFYAPGLERMKGEGDIDIPAQLRDEKIPVLEYRDIDWVYARDVDWACKVKLNGGYRKFGEDHGGELAWGGAIHSLGDYFPIDSHKEQPCLSDPRNIASAIEQIGKKLEENPDLDVFEISQNDNQNYCKCERCAAVDAEEGNHAGTLIRFINALSDAFRDKYPKLHFQTFAYQYTRTPPKVTKPRDNVIIKLCPMECCYHHPLYDPDCPQNVAFASDLEGWNKVAKKIYIWDYSTNFCYFVAPFPNLEVQRLNMRWFADNNVKGLYPEGNYISRSGEFAELRGYLQARMMWDPYMSKEEYYDCMYDFMEAYYGPGWREIRKFIEFTEQESVKRHCDLWSHPSLVIPLEVWHDRCAEIDGWWNAAEEAAKDMPEQLANVRRSRLQFTFLKQTVTWEERFRDGDKASRDAYRFENQKFYNTLVLENIAWREAYPFPPKVNFSAPPLAWCNAHTYGEPETED